MRGARDPNELPDRERQQEVVRAFLLAARTGDLAGLLAVLHPDVVLHADAFAVQESARQQARGAPLFAPEMFGAEAVAKTYLGRAGAAQVALIDGGIGAGWAPQGTPRAALSMTVVDGRIVAIDVVADPSELSALAISILSEPT
jgi:hypothetical protein